ncbi:tape measure protein [Rhodococcus sp. NPDC060176]|uniref:tape measure protein n=1 Tax=Rhodococcus sp. NPDC060176 TaxID=3347062 RepID=UPI003652886D
MASGIGSAFKVGGAAIGAAAALTIGTALNKGMERVVAIDDAKGKLAGLGHTTEGVAGIMDSALKSVKGTAFGLGDAAGIAASAVAAGVKPGEDLTKYLSLTGDAATIAGSSLGEMGSIFNKVQTSGKAYTDTLNQLNDRGIPVFTWLQEEYGVSSEALSKMVKEGKVDAETFNKVIRDKIGGAALESGKTLRGSFKNMQAALGRIGEQAIAPFIPMMLNGMNKVSEWSDKIAPKVGAGAKFIADGLTGMGRAFMSSGASIDGAGSNFEKFGARARKVADGVQGLWSVLTKGEHLGAGKTFGLEEDSGTVQMLLRIRDGAIALWAALKSPSGEKFSGVLDAIKGSGDGAAGTMGKVESGASTLMGALKAVGAAAAGGGIALASLGGDTATVAVAGIKALGGVMSFFADHTGLATAALGGLAAAFVATKAVQTGYDVAFIARTIMQPAQTASQIMLTRALSAHSIALRQYIVAVGGTLPPEQASWISRARLAVTTRLSAAATASATSGLMAYAAAQRAAAASSGLLIGGLRQTAASMATFGARAQGVAAGAMAGMRTAGSGLMTMMGGPFGAAMIAATVGIGLFMQSNADAKAQAEELRTAVSGVAESLDASGGAFTANGQLAAANALESIKLSDKSTSLSKALSDVGVSASVAAQGLAGNLDALKRTRAELEAQAGKQGDFWGGFLDMPDASSFSWESIKSQFTPGGQKDAINEQYSKDNPAAEALKKYDEAEAAIRDKQESLRRVAAAGGDARVSFDGTTASVGTMAAAMDEFRKSTGGAADKIGILSGGLAKLRGDQFSAEEAQKKVNDAIRGFGEAAAGAGASVDAASGKIDTSTAAGSRLFDSMMSVRSAFDDAGAQARTAAAEQKLSTGEAAAAVEAAGQRIRDDFIRQAMEADYSRAAAEALANQYGLLPKELVTNVKLTGTSEAQAAIEQFIAANQGRKIVVDIMQNVVAPGPSNAPATSLGDFMLPGGNYRGARLPKNSKGSRMPTTGPGTDRTDGILGIGSNGVPTSWVDKGEWIINGRSSEKYNGLLAAINRDDPRLKNLPAYAEGGRNGITNALSAGKSVEGNTYLWGGTGPTNFDCSGFVGWLHQIVMGVTGSIKRLYTTYNLMGSSGVGGLQPGLGPAGTQFQVGVSQEHMAATIAGHSAESGGAHGTSGIDGGRANAQSSQFSKKWYLPNALIANWIEGQSSTAVPNGVSGASTSRKVEWTEKNQLDLESAEISITQAEEARAEVEAKFREGKKSQADLDQANKRVEKAQQRRTDLQKKKDDAAAGVDEGPAPQAPGMAQAFSEAEMERLEAQMSVDDANERRNEVYAKADSTENDRRRADIALQKAENSLAEILRGKKKEGEKDYSLAGIGKTFAHSAVDALFTGLEGQDYFGIGQSRWVTTDWSKLAGEPAIDAPEAAPFTQAQIAAQTGGMTVQQILEERLGIKAPKVFDNGGWLRPGETAINLSNKPEPIFNSPAQLSQFAGREGLKPAQPAVNDYSIHIGGDMVASNTDELVKNLRFEQKRLVYGLTGG